MGSVLYVHAPSDPVAIPCGWHPVLEADLDAALHAGPVDVVVLGPSLDTTIEAIQRVHVADRFTSVILGFDTDGDPLRRALRYSPGIPEDLVLVKPSEDLVAVVEAAREQALRRRRYAKLLESVAPRLQMSQPQPAQAGLAAIGALLEHAPVGVVVTDAAGRLTTWNDKAASMLDLGMEEAQLPFADLFDDEEIVAAALATAMSSLQSIPGIRCRLRNLRAALEISVAPTRLEDGTPSVLVLLLDVTEQERAERARDDLAERLEVSHRAQAFLLEASDVLAQAAGYDETMQSLAAVAVPALADLCLIDVLDDNGEQRRVSARHADPTRQPLADELRLRYPPDARGEHPIVQSIRDRRTRWSASVTTEFLRATSRDDRHFDLLVELGFTGYITVPLIARNRALGTVTLMSCGERRFDEHTVELAEALAGRVAAVVDKARRYDREHMLAVALQRALQTAIPDVAPLEIAARYVPARKDTEVGGDWYDVFKMSNGDIAVVIGDVVGHDLAAATRMGELRNLLRAIALDRQEPPAEILARMEKLNDALAVVDFATIAYGLLELDRTGGYRFRWVNAGHLPPLLALPDGTSRLLDDNLDVALGLGATRRRKEDSIPLAPGATVVLYTDGLVETRAHQLEVGLPALVHHSAELATEPLACFTDKLLRSLSDHAEDDIAMLVIRIPSAEHDPVAASSATD